jgi:hypothetical protein
MGACQSNLRSDPDQTLVDHDDDVVSGSKETPWRCSLEGDSVADAVSCSYSSRGGEGDGVGVETSDHVMWVGEREGDRQPTVAATDHRHSPPGWLHRLLLGLVGDVGGVERVAGDFVHFQIDEPGFVEHLEGELFAPRSAQPGAAFGQ